VPESYSIAYAALDAVWEDHPTESLAIFLGGMRVNPPDGMPTDPAFLPEWKEVTKRTKDASQLEWLIAYLEHDANLYRDVPDDLQSLIDALRTKGTREWSIVDAVISERQFGNRMALCRIICTVHEFADLGYQQRVWVKGEGPESSSYTEAMCALFDDAQVARFIADDYALTLGFSQAMVETLAAFIEILEAFDGVTQRDTDDAHIVALPAWRSVTNCAANFLDSAITWLQQNCTDYPMGEWAWRGQLLGNR
jgi:hypothetical protein